MINKCVTFQGRSELTVCTCVWTEKEETKSGESGMFLRRFEMKKVRRATGMVSHDPA